MQKKASGDDESVVVTRSTSRFNFRRILARRSRGHWCYACYGALTNLTIYSHWQCLLQPPHQLIGITAERGTQDILISCQ